MNVPLSLKTLRLEAKKVNSRVRFTKKLENHRWRFTLELSAPSHKRWNSTKSHFIKHSRSFMNADDASEALDSACKAFLMAIRGGLYECEGRKSDTCGICEAQKNFCDASCDDCRNSREK